VKQVRDFTPAGCARLGHNGGPPLDLSWNAGNWRRAHAAAWKTPGREVALLRLRRAAALGLSYRDYTSLILDRGVRLSAVVVMLRGALLACEDRVLRKLETLDCMVLVCASHVPAPLAACLEAKGALSADVAESADIGALIAAVRELTAQTTLSPSSIFMVGMTGDERAAAERAGLGLFVDARNYFELSWAVPPGA
jgi:hypothetical protein